MLLNEIAAYWDTRAEGYSISIHEQLGGKMGEYYLELLRRVKPKKEKMECLDIGCGPGFFSILLKKDGHNVVSMDYSEEMLEKTKENLEEMGFEAHTVRGDAQHLSFEDHRFDLIVSRDLVWNLEDPGQAYQEWIRVLKPGGVLFVSDGNYYLHYYNEDYKKARENSQKGGSSHSCHGIDPTPINEIARKLPMSKCLRPNWDVETLSQLGLKKIQTQISERPFTDPQTGEVKRLIGHFELWGEK